MLLSRTLQNNLNDNIRRVDWGLPSLMLKLLCNNIQLPSSNFPIITPVYAISHIHILVYRTEMYYWCNNYHIFTCNLINSHPWLHSFHIYYPCIYTSIHISRYFKLHFPIVQYNNFAVRVCDSVMEPDHANYCYYYKDGYQWHCLS